MEPLNWIIEHFINYASITKGEVQEKFGPELIEQVTLILNYLVNQKIISQSSRKGEILFTVNNLDAIKKISFEQKSITSISRESGNRIDTGRDKLSTQELDQLVVSVPLSMVGKFQSLKTSYPQLAIEEMRKGFSKLLLKATKEILLSVPFLELDGLMVFVDEFKELGNRQVLIKTLTREIVLPSKFDYGYYQKLRAISKMIDLYTSGGGDPKNIEVRDYTIKMGGTGERGIIYEGIHQKMIVADRYNAYIGSGEIRAPSFIVNGDVGVIQTGVAAEFWAEYFMLFWSEAQKVDNTFFRIN